MPDIAMQIDVAADATTVYRALTTVDGIAGWWNTKNETSGNVGDLNRYWFPDAPMSWDMRVVETIDGNLVGWHCEGGPPPWIGTDVRWTLEPAPEAGTRIVFDHRGFGAVDEKFRVVTLGWAQMLLRLKEYADTGKPVPFFDH